MANYDGDTGAANESREEHRSGRVVKVPEIAVLLGVSESSVMNWIKLGMPVKFRGERGVAHRIDTAQAVVWLLKRERENGEKGGAEAADYKTRIGIARARREERENALADGRVVEIEAVERVLSNVAAGVRARLLSLPTRLAPRIATEGDAAEIRRVLDEAIGEALTEISEIQPAAFLSEDAAEMVEESA